MRVALLVLSLTCNFATYAHGPEVGFFTQGGTYLGELAGPGPTILTPSGYFLKIGWSFGPTGTVIRSVHSYRAVYKSANCSGEGYFGLNPYGGNNHLIEGGSLVVAVKPKPQIAQIEWLPVLEKITPLSESDSDGNCVDYQPSDPPVDAWVKFKIHSDLSSFEISKIDEYNYGFPEPLVVQKTTSDILFCSGFESCE